MPRKSLLEDASVRDLIVSVMQRDGNLDKAGAELEAQGYSRLTPQAINKWARMHPDSGMRERLDAASERREVVAHRVPAVLSDPRVIAHRAAEVSRAEQEGAAEALGVPVEMVQDVDRLPGLSAFDLILEVERIALDPEHRASPRALDIICELKLGKMVRAQKRREEREADRVAASESVSQGDQAAIIELPVNETEAPGRAPVPMSRAGIVLDAEVVDRG